MKLTEKLNMELQNSSAIEEGTFKIIGIIISKNTLELVKDKKRFYFKLPSSVNALKTFKTGQDFDPEKFKKDHKKDEAAPKMKKSKGAESAKKIAAKLVKEIESALAGDIDDVVKINKFDEDKLKKARLHARQALKALA